MKSLAVLDHLVRKVLRREPSPPSYEFIRSADGQTRGASSKDEWARRPLQVF